MNSFTTSSANIKEHKSSLLAFSAKVMETYGHTHNWIVFVLYILDIY